MHLVFFVVVMVEEEGLSSTPNCRGACRAPAVRTLKGHVRGLKPDVLFLLETKIKTPRLEKRKIKLDFENLFCVNPVRKAGGLPLMWRNEVDLEVVFSNKNVIVALIHPKPPNDPWMLFAIYDPPSRVKRKHFWELMQNMVNSFSGPWVIVGDSNCIKGRGEKKKVGLLLLKAQSIVSESLYRTQGL